MATTMHGLPLLSHQPTKPPGTMLRYAAIFLVIAIIAAVFGFGGIAAGAATIAKVLFFIFLVLFVLSLLFGAKLFKKSDL